MLKPGLYEQVINDQLNSELSKIPEARKAIAPIDKAEASQVLTQYLADVVQKGLDNVVDNGGDISAQIALTNQIVDLIQTTTKEADFDFGVGQLAQFLNCLDIRRPHIRRGDNTELATILGKLPQLVHYQPKPAPLDEGHQHFDLVR